MINQSPNLIAGSEVVSFRYLPESDSLVVVLVNGDIEQIFEPGNGGNSQRLVGWLPLSSLRAGTDQDEFRGRMWVLSKLESRLLLGVLMKSYW